MIAFSYTILYDEARVWVETQSHEFLLAANAGSAVFNVSDITPDQGFNNRWTGAAVDISDWAIVPPEYGSGVLSRLGISISETAPQAMYSLTLTEAGHVDTLNDAYPPGVLNHAVIAVGMACPQVTPTPAPTATPPETPTPGPTATPPVTPSPAPTATPALTPTPRPPALAVSFEPQARLWPSDSLVLVHGTVTCSAPSLVEVQVVVQQFARGETVLAAAPGAELVACNGEAEWSATLRPEYGRFRPGEAEIVVLAHVRGWGSVGASGSVHLKPGNAR
jgi:hypothetical protein